MEVSLAALVLLAVVVPVVVWWLMMIVDAVRVPTSRWEASGQNQLVAVFLMVALGVIGTLIYVFAIRPRLRAAS